MVLYGKGRIKAGQGFEMPLCLLTNFEIKRFYQKEPKSDGFYSRNNLPKIKDETYVINLDKDK